MKGFFLNIRTKHYEIENHQALIKFFLFFLRL